jgi:hypothetical protein
MAAFTVLLLSTAAWAQYEHPDLKSRKIVVKNAMILPPNVKIMKSGVKGSEELIEEEHKIEDTLPPIIGAVLQERHCSVPEKGFDSASLEKDQELKYAVADLQKRFDELFPQLTRKPKDVRKGRFTMGDEVAKLNPGGATDALVFVRGFGQSNTGGKVFLAAMAGLSVFSGAVIHVVVVDARTGVVLYYGVSVQSDSPVKNPAQTQKAIGKSFKNFPGK